VRDPSLHELAWCAVAEAGAGSVVELVGDGSEVAVAELVEVGALGEVLAQQAIRVLVRASLPWRVRIGEVDPDPGSGLDPLVVEHLVALIPGQGPADTGRQRTERLDQPVTNDLSAVAASERDQDRVSGLALDQRGDR